MLAEGVAPGITPRGRAGRERTGDDGNGAVPSARGAAVARRPTAADLARLAHGRRTAPAGPRRPAAARRRPQPRRVRRPGHALRGPRPQPAYERSRPPGKPDAEPPVAHGRAA